ncbi:hypothetical protein ACWGMK_06175 [Agrobacterium deltaense]
MARGGKRDGAGRTAGAVSRKTREVAEKAASEGITPLDYMLTILRNEDADVKDRMWAAEKAAPYVHAKLANVDVNAKLEGNLAVTFQTIYEKRPDNK